MNTTDKIVITGLGVASPCGCGLDAFHAGLRSGTDALSDYEPPWPTGYRRLRAGLVRDGALAGCSHDGDAETGRATRLAGIAAGMALEDSVCKPARMGMIVGTTWGDCRELEHDWRALRQGAALPGDASARMRVGSIGDRLAARFNVSGPRRVVTTACAAGNHALALAAEALLRDRADAMLVVAADTIGYVDVLGFTRLLLQAPERCQPFDKRRKGTILSEGGGAMVLETAERAAARGARIRAELAGWGVSCDAGGPFASDMNDMRGLHVAARRALRRARLSPETIDYVSAHGSGTKLNDAKETAFLKQLLGERASDVPVSSIKSMIGHAQGCAAMLEAIACVLTIENEVLFPTIHYEQPDARCDLDYVPNEARPARVNTILSNAFGVGGNNAIVVLKRWERN